MAPPDIVSQPYVTKVNRRPAVTGGGNPCLPVAGQYNGGSELTAEDNRGILMPLWAVLINFKRAYIIMHH